jgi:hypothetical protein
MKRSRKEAKAKAGKAGHCAKRARSKSDPDTSDRGPDGSD